MGQCTAEGWGHDGPCWDFLQNAEGGSQHTPCGGRTGNSSGPVVWDMEIEIEEKIKIHDLLKVLLPFDGLAWLSACCQINLHIDRLDLKVCAFLGKRQLAECAVAAAFSPINQTRWRRWWWWWHRLVWLMHFCKFASQPGLRRKGRGRVEVEGDLSELEAGWLDGNPTTDIFASCFP